MSEDADEAAVAATTVAVALFPRQMLTTALRVGRLGEHPLAVIYAFNESLEAHGTIFYISIGLCVTGVMVEIWTRLNKETA